jgi:hypothetical protein
MSSIPAITPRVMMQQEKASNFWANNPKSKAGCAVAQEM